MKTDTAQRIIEYLTQHPQSSPKDLYNLLNISSRAVFKQLSILCNKKLIQKIGHPPKVYYTIASNEPIRQKSNLKEQTKRLINDNFYYVTPLGREQIGLEGFETWCQKQNLEVTKTAEEYVTTFSKYAQYKKNGLIDGMHKMSTTFDRVMLDKLFYLDFYAIERFGKTKLGQLLLLAKSSQNKKQISDRKSTRLNSSH